MHILATIFCFEPYLVAKFFKKKKTKQKQSNKNKNGKTIYFTVGLAWF